MARPRNKVLIVLLSLLLLIAPFGASAHVVLQAEQSAHEVPCHQVPAQDNCCERLICDACQCCEQAAPAGLIPQRVGTGFFVALSLQPGSPHTVQIDQPTQYPPYRPPIADFA
ncbi:MAG: hypothetical protein ACWA5Q_01550 [bacterium]